MSAKPTDPQIATDVVIADATRLLGEFPLDKLAEFKEGLPEATFTFGSNKGHTSPTMRLIKLDGVELVVCNKVPECTYVAEKTGRVMSHMRAHSNNPPVYRRQHEKIADHVEAVQAKLSKIQQELEEIAKDVREYGSTKTASANEERWKKRALEAEKELREHKHNTSALRRALERLT